MTSLLILGAGGHAKVVAETALASGHFIKTPLSSLNPCSSPESSSLFGFPVSGLFLNSKPLFSSSILVMLLLL